MPLDPRINTYLRRLSSVAAPLELAARREAAEIGLRELHGPLEAVAAIDTWTVPGHEGHPIRVRAYIPDGAAPDAVLPALVFAHGGGWFQCSLELYDNPCRALANATQCKVLSVDYRLTPESKFPIPLEDFYAALVWVSEHADRLGIDPARIAVGGDSAGGNLAAAAAIMARDRQGPAIAHQLLCYPVVDHDFSTASYQAYGQNFFLTEEVMRYCWFTYLVNEADGASPYASPLRADLAGLPPATLLICEYDPLRDEGQAYARKLREAGVDARDHLLPGMVHACIHMLGLTPDARRLFDLAGEALARQAW
ncbi:Carboxylesterase NlhH [Achromobacter deleyi]|uniref:Carboxylesterase NlhH n=1 Tax=Achromobacter deleyi TaxID=1353891 RepID=A0A6S6ZW62_9BURK|nr:alpha/beta hydrolase [Achromobacter deleyi]CAB3664742.1 Carboxylesterase NlhH [Achromobacter deleyi]CAB3823265.1 Carboxylesterase NlhH [Achromobacter deleyi]CAB3834892.1 Carboxylesterase NlhH [Achromobacter deleyi]